MSATFAPQFIQSRDLQRQNNASGIMEGENDLSGKRYVWIKDPEKAFVRGWVVEEQGNGMLLVQCEDDRVLYDALTEDSRP